ncbi:membrane protein, putative [Babesia bigemina]|uniref:Membrane protein, putative n=1 Tax=Babesia bigemina TaxID=5866 RepID=A0A061DD51_BABBI|nr:membrane protein, putative [Babesia bigemina]CDR95960.1 membrane protein, putative [Babesia bigemina]|eukprot:XP_012768146.1 membrane protein, putative [Babesia bigemina]
MGPFKLLRLFHILAFAGYGLTGPAVDAIIVGILDLAPKYDTAFLESDSVAGSAGTPYAHDSEGAVEEGSDSRKLLKKGKKAGAARAKSGAVRAKGKAKPGAKKRNVTKKKAAGKGKKAKKPKQAKKAAKLPTPQISTDPNAKYMRYKADIRDPLHFYRSQVTFGDGDNPENSVYLYFKTPLSDADIKGLLKKSRVKIVDSSFVPMGPEEMSRLDAADTKISWIYDEQQKKFFRFRGAAKGEGAVSTAAPSAAYVESTSAVDGTAGGSKSESSTSAPNSAPPSTSGSTVTGETEGIPTSPESGTAESESKAAPAESTSTSGVSSESDASTPKAVDDAAGSSVDSSGEGSSSIDSGSEGSSSVDSGSVDSDSDESSSTESSSEGSSSTESSGEGSSSTESSGEGSSSTESSSATKGETKEAKEGETKTYTDGEGELQEASTTASSDADAAVTDEEGEASSAPGSTDESSADAATSGSGSSEGAETGAASAKKDTPVTGSYDIVDENGDPADTSAHKETIDDEIASDSGEDGGVKLTGFKRLNEDGEVIASSEATGTTQDAAAATADKKRGRKKGSPLWSLRRIQNEVITTKKRVSTLENRMGKADKKLDEVVRL